MDGGKKGQYSAEPGVAKLCLDAVMVALNQTCKTGGWYASTTQLQLASLQFCSACRSVTTLTVEVDDDIPRRLLGSAKAPSSNWKRPCSTRVPQLRARRVVWGLSTAARLRTPKHAVGDACVLHFGRVFDDTLKRIVWPHRLKILEFHERCCCNRPIVGVAWPKTLEQLVFGKFFNQPLEGAVLPPSLLHLRSGDFFDQRTYAIEWPRSLLRITFGSDFNQPVEGVSCPVLLQQLSFGSEFNRPIEGIMLPDTLTHLCFGSCFNQPIERVAWPDSIKKVSVGSAFNQPIAGATWPSSLHELSCGGCEQYVVGPRESYVFWASSFNQVLDRTRWPARLRRITLGGEFRQSLKRLSSWMPDLEELCLLSDEQSACESF